MIEGFPYIYVLEHSDIRTGVPPVGYDMLLTSLVKIILRQFTFLMKFKCIISNVLDLRRFRGWIICSCYLKHNALMITY